MLGFEVLSRSAYLYTICGDATNTCEVDTPIKAPNVLFSSFLGSIAHNQTLKVWIPLSLFVIYLYDGVKPVENLVNITIVVRFIQLYV